MTQLDDTATEAISPFGQERDVTEASATELQEALQEVRRWSSTYYQVITQTPPGLQEAITSFYLLFRGIDEIEDHPDLSTQLKDQILTEVADALQTRNVADCLANAFAAHRDVLPEVSLRLADWCALAPKSIAPRIVDAAIAMAHRMAVWARRNWHIGDVDDFDHYGFSVAGVGATLLADIWAWHDGTQIDRTAMMSYARCMQAANILADREIDRERGVDFMPEGWTEADLVQYIVNELEIAARMVAALPDPSPARDWCSRAVQVAQTQVHRVRLSPQTLKPECDPVARTTHEGHAAPSLRASSEPLMLRGSGIEETLLSTPDESGAARRTSVTVLEQGIDEVRRWSAAFGQAIALMPLGLQGAIASAYLVYRGIDEIEDHPDLATQVKDQLLTDVACALQTRNVAARLDVAFAKCRDVLPEVTLRMADWCTLAPDSIAPRIVDAAAAHADRMAVWARNNWRIRDVNDLDHYGFSVAGGDTLLFSDIWAWHDGFQVDRTAAMSYGRCFQTANILADLEVDRSRGVDFVPDGWRVSDLVDYTLTELEIADRLVAALPEHSPLSELFRRNLDVSHAEIERVRQT